MLAIPPSFGVLMVALPDHKPLVAFLSGAIFNTTVHGVQLPVQVSPDLSISVSWDQLVIPC